MHFFLVFRLFQQGRNSQLGLRIGSLIFHQIGQLLPHQLKEFHNENFIYPIGFSVTRFYWSPMLINKRVAYKCTISDSDGLPEFCIEFTPSGQTEPTKYREASAKGIL